MRVKKCEECWCYYNEEHTHICKEWIKKIIEDVKEYLNRKKKNYEVSKHK